MHRDTDTHTSMHTQSSAEKCVPHIPKHILSLYCRTWSQCFSRHTITVVFGESCQLVTQRCFRNMVRAPEVLFDS